MRKRRTPGRDKEYQAYDQPDYILGLHAPTSAIRPGMHCFIVPGVKKIANYIRIARGRVISAEVIPPKVAKTCPRKGWCSWANKEYPIVL